MWLATVDVGWPCAKIIKGLSVVSPTDGLDMTVRNTMLYLESVSFTNKNIFSSLLAGAKRAALYVTMFVTGHYGPLEFLRDIVIKEKLI